jgi:hypothetical protein
VALGLVRLVALAASSLPGAVVTMLSVVVYTGGFIGSLGAVVTGARALRGGQQQPPLEPAARVAAGAGVVIGIAGLLLLVIGGVILAQVLHVCSTNPANCG